MTEIGGTVGDIESLPFLEAIRQFRREVGPENVLYLHVTLVPFIEAAGELKTKPTQHSVNELRRIGIHPDIIVCRSRDALSPDIREKIALFADVDPEAVIANRDVLRRLPRPVGPSGGGPRHARLREARPAGGRRRPRRVARADRAHPRTARRRGRDRARRQVREAPATPTSRCTRRSSTRASTTAARSTSAGSTPRACRSRRPQSELEQVDGVLVPGGFGSRGWEGKILACRVARERGIPYLGICLGMHVAVSEFARHVVGLDGRELDRDGPGDAVPGDRPPARAEGDRGPRRDDAARRAGGRARRGHARAGEIYGEAVIHERHRHRYEVNNHFRPKLVEAGLVVSGTFQEGRLVEIVELPGPSVVRREPVPPRVQVAPDAARAALPRVRRRRASRATRAASRDRSRCSGSVLESAPVRPGWAPDVLSLFLELAALPSPPGEERAVADRVLAYLRALGLEPDEDDAGARIGSTIGNLYCRLAPNGAGRRAALLLRPPRHGAAEGPARAGRRRTASSGTRAGRSSAPTTRRRSRRCSRRGAAASRRAARMRGSSCSSRRRRRSGCSARRRSTSSGSQAQRRLRLRPAGPDRRDRARRAVRSGRST